INICRDAAHECRIYRFADRLKWDATDMFEQYLSWDYAQRLSYHRTTTAETRPVLSPIAGRYRAALLIDPGSTEALGSFQGIAGQADMRGFALVSAADTDTAGVAYSPAALLAADWTQARPAGATPVSWPGLYTPVEAGASVGAASGKYAGLSLNQVFANEAAAWLGSVAYVSGRAGAGGAGPFPMGPNEYWAAIADVYASYVEAS
ncbi:unnamed protein product, partial [marine sediment metagenome]